MNAYECLTVKWTWEPQIKNLTNQKNHEMKIYSKIYLDNIYIKYIYVYITIYYYIYIELILYIYKRIVFLLKP